MLLDYRTFCSLNELVDYVNDLEITKLDIQEVRKNGDEWILLYWKW